MPHPTCMPSQHEYVSPKYDHPCGGSHYAADGLNFEQNKLWDEWAAGIVRLSRFFSSFIEQCGVGLMRSTLFFVSSRVMIHHRVLWRPRQSKDLAAVVTMAHALGLVYTYDTSTSISISHVWTGTTQAQAHEKAWKSRSAFLFLVLVPASSRFTRGLCLCLCLHRTCKPALRPQKVYLFILFSRLGGATGKIVVDSFPEPRVGYSLSPIEE